MIYEERSLKLKRGAVAELAKLSREVVWPTLAGQGARVLGLFNGQIGAPPEEAIQVIGFQDFAQWESLQLSSGSQRPVWLPYNLWPTLREALLQRAELIQEERVRLMKPFGSRPKPGGTPPEDWRRVYGYRRFTIKPADWPQFVKDSEEGIWPRIEKQGACILGLWRDAAETDPLDVTLLTGYNDAAHWQATRTYGQRPESFSEEDWQVAGQGVRRRADYTISSFVRLMTAHPWLG